MKAKLILKKHNDCYSLNDYSEPSKGYPLVIAHSDDENFRYKLSKQNCDEIFGVVDVEKLAKESTLEVKETNPDFIFKEVYEEFFKEGFNKAMELNKDKVFTLEDMFDLYAHIVKNGVISGEEANKFIQSLQQPTEIEVEIVMETKKQLVNGYRNQPDNVIGFVADYENILQPKLDSQGCLILKKI